MKSNLADATMQMNIHQYQVVGRAAPTKKVPEPKIYRMKLFARNHVLAKSKFWYFMKKLHKAKKTGGEVLQCKEIVEKNTRSVKNFAVWLRYDSRTGTHNVYKEFRDLTQNGAISQLYSEMAGRHRASPESIQIIGIRVIPDKMAKRPHITQVLKKGLKFPHIRRLPMQPRQLNATFRATRPSTFYA